jgi:hypothetical protein
MPAFGGGGCEDADKRRRDEAAHIAEYKKRLGFA